MIYNHLTIKKSPEVSGIYIITCTGNCKSYIGQAVNINKRWERHERELRKNYHPNILLLNSVKKYGINSLEFKILEIVKNKKSLTNRERFYINKYETLVKGFNMCVPGKFPETIKQSKLESKNKIKVLLLNKNTLEVEYVFNSVTETATFLNKTTSQVSKCCKQNLNKLSYSIKGFVAIYNSQFSKELKYIKCNKSKSNKTKKLMNKNNARSKKVFVFNSTKKCIEEFPSLLTCRLKYNISDYFIRRIYTEKIGLKLNETYFNYSKDFPVKVIEIVENKI